MSKQPLTPRTTETRKRSPTATPTRAAASPRPAKPTAKNSKKTPPSPSSSLPPLLRALLEDPNALRHLRQHLPSWFDEVLAALLIGVGGVIFASLFNQGGEGETAGLVSNFLRQGFGQGAYLVALVILGLGVVILLPKIGINIALSWGQIIALEVLFVCVQGVLHGMSFENESRALAREGGGGGYVGWAVNSAATALVGEPMNLVLLGVFVFLSLHHLSGIRRKHYRAMVQGFSQSLKASAARFESPAPPVMSAPPSPVQEKLTAKPPSKTPSPAPVLPVPPMQEADPPPAPAMPAPSTPSLKPMPPRKTAPSTPVEKAPIPRPPAPPAPIVAETALPVMSAPAPVAEAAPPDEKEENDEEFIVVSTERPALVINGQVVETSSLPSRPSIVQRNTEAQAPAVFAPLAVKYRGGRDDNPHKRLFTVADFEERKKIGKRDEGLPPLDLLQPYDMFKPDDGEVNRNASIIENTLLEFDIDADVIDVKVGPVVTQYAVSPIKEVRNPLSGQMEINRVRVDRITSLQNDLSMALAAKTLRIEAPVPGHSYVGIEVPNRKPSIVGLRSVLESETFFKKRKSPLSVPLGRDVSGEAVIMDIATMPHLLVAGTTGSGKSVFLTAVICSLVMNNLPEDVRLILLDPKRVELPRFNGLPHLLGPVETEADRIVGVLRWTTREMDRRYKLLELENARNIDAYNNILGRRRKEEHLPYIVMIVDEIGDLILTRRDEVEPPIIRLAQKARAAGIHLLLATQRPSTDVITGIIKANFPGRLSFAVASGIDSRVILDYVGAESLLGRGDMLFLAPDAAAPRRIQGCYVSDDELERIVDFWRARKTDDPAEAGPSVPPWERGMTRLEALTEQDPMLAEAIQCVCEAGEASTSLIQRRLGVGYPRAARLMDLLYELGIIGPPKAGGKPREVRYRSYQEALKQMNKNR